MQRTLVERAQRGDRDAYATLAAAAIARLDATARLILRDPDGAKDAVQEMLIRAWRKLPTLRDPDRFDARLHRLLVRSCIDETRTSRGHRVDISLADLEMAGAHDSTSAVAIRDELNAKEDSPCIESVESAVGSPSRQRSCSQSSRFLQVRALVEPWSSTTMGTRRVKPTNPTSAAGHHTSMAISPTW